MGRGKVQEVINRRTFVYGKDYEVKEEVGLEKLETFLLPNGVYKIPSYEDLMSFSKEAIIQFGVKHAMYVLPTIQLIRNLNILIGDSQVVEIGSGNGILGKALGIRCTDNFCQDRPEVKSFYRESGQTPVKYGSHVEKRDAEWVAKKWRPDIIIGSWITHKYNPLTKTGNVYGPDEEVILDNCKQYIMLGNKGVHRDKPILKYRPDIIDNFPGYVTKSINPENNCVYIFKGKK